jgi:hypothetical protein
MAALVHDSAKLGQHRVAEALAVRLDEQVARARQHHAEAAGAFVRMEKQAADLARSL